ncbi:DNA mismatch repair protein MutS [Rhodovulum sp. 12E13]|uniref:Smr/MutS family protein n=1 Tax=Rhodovulum sp. 12E13 TaxID=2203891 RepID=UPI000E13CE19|nr:Smr/MutS family protein [Rhodovulum sp. 12E13]RDC73794.1 DNA mismatch repair protein MutS [Rhodovulum sp. 12E13]
MSRRRKGHLSDDDLALWRQVARTATPLPGDRPRKPPGQDAQPRSEVPDKATRARPQRQTAIEPFRIGSEARATDRGHDLTPTIRGQLERQPLRMDHKVFTRMKRGKLRPERRIDLHGMTLAQAHPALRAFVRQAHADGLRLVVVITGKGSTGRDEGGPIPQPRGVLRRQVPGWLHSPDLRPYVLQVSDAHLRHGGGGAYYVCLTRGPAAGGRRG